MFKQLISLAIITFTTQAELLEASAGCMYCRRMDFNSGFLVSYSFCEQTLECLQDAWNYINRDCEGDWQTGKSYDLQTCKPTDITCPTIYESTEEKYGAYQNATWTLTEGSHCIVQLDATQAIARVIFDETSYLGLDGTSKKLGEVITYEQGTPLEESQITIYNAAESGPLTFLISFSGAASMTAAAIASAMLSGLSF